MNLTRYMLVYFLLFSGLSHSKEETELVCKDSVDKLTSVIEEWYLLIKPVEEKNTSVVNLYSDFKNGVLEERFIKHCFENWDHYKDVFTCFSGIRSELGAQMCLHPDTNRNAWFY